MTICLWHKWPGGWKYVSTLAGIPTRGSMMCMTRDLSWVLGWLVMYTWPDHKVHWWPLLGSLSMLHFTHVRLPWHLLGIGCQWMISTGAQFLDGLRCLWPGWLGASLQWLGGPSSGHQRAIIVLLSILLYPYPALLVLLPALIFEYIYDVTTAINIFWLDLTWQRACPGCLASLISQTMSFKCYSFENK